MSLRAACGRVVGRCLTRLVWALRRAHLIRAVVVDMSRRAAACWEAARQDAGSPEAMNAHGLLRKLLDDPDCGLVRFLRAQGADLAALRARLGSIVPAVDAKGGFHGAFPTLVRRSYEVVPVEAVPGQHDRRQVLHTIHFLRGFAADPSESGAVFREACPLAAGARRDAVEWTRWHDDERIARVFSMAGTPRTPARTEVLWFTAVLFYAVAVAVGGAVYLLWRVLGAAAHC